MPDSHRNGWPSNRRSQLNRLKCTSWTTLCNKCRMKTQSWQILWWHCKTLCVTVKRVWCSWESRIGMRSRTWRVPCKAWLDSRSRMSWPWCIRRMRRRRRSGSLRANWWQHRSKMSRQSLSMHRLVCSLPEFRSILCCTKLNRGSRPPSRTFQRRSRIWHGSSRLRRRAYWSGLNT